MEKIKKNIYLIFISLMSFIFVYMTFSLSNNRADVELIRQSYSPVFIFAFNIFALALGFMAQIIFHELGHMVVGLFLGYDFIFFRIGSLTLVKSNGKFKFGRYDIPGTGGQALLAPGGKAYENFNYKSYMYGGVATNLFISLLSLLAHILIV